MPHRLEGAAGAQGAFPELGVPQQHSVDCVLYSTVQHAPTVSLCVLNGRGHGMFPTCLEMSLELSGLSRCSRCTGAAQYTVHSVDCVTIE